MLYIYIALNTSNNKYTMCNIKLKICLTVYYFIEKKFTFICNVVFIFSFLFIRSFYKLPM